MQGFSAIKARLMKRYRDIHVDEGYFFHWHLVIKDFAF
jgi:hypothetical protein